MSKLSPELGITFLPIQESYLRLFLRFLRFGALALTAGIFLPAFAFTLIGHEYVERLVDNKATHAFLDGVTAGVVGLIAVTALGLCREAITDWRGIIIFLFALFAVYWWKARAAVVGIMLGAGFIGWMLS